MSSAPTGCRPPLASSMEGGGFGFPFGGDPEDLLRGIQEFAAQQAESVQEAQREQFATLTLNTAVELTAAALKQVQPSGSDRRAGGRAPRRDARALPRGGRARLARPARASCANRARRLGCRAVSLLDRAVVTLLPAVPKRGRAALSSRYIAGSSLDDARRVVAELNADGQAGDRRRARRGGRAARPRPQAIAAEYVAALEPSSGTTSTPTSASSRRGSGSKLGYDLCKRNVEAVIAAAEPTNRFVRIDMEDSSTTDDTLRLFRELRDEGHGRVGPVLQASLKRTVADAASLAGASVRLCKGIYVEPESIQFRDDEDGAGQLRRRRSRRCSTAAATRRSRRTTSGSSSSALGADRERGLEPERVRVPDAARRAARARRPHRRRRPPRSGSTSRTAASGTSTRSGGCRRTRRSPATSPAISDVRSFRRR